MTFEHDQKDTHYKQQRMMRYHWKHQQSDFQTIETIFGEIFQDMCYYSIAVTVHTAQHLLRKQIDPNEHKTME